MDLVLAGGGPVTVAAVEAALGGAPARDAHGRSSTRSPRRTSPGCSPASAALLDAAHDPRRIAEGLLSSLARRVPARGRRRAGGRWTSPTTCRRDCACSAKRSATLRSCASLETLGQAVVDMRGTEAADPRLVLEIALGAPGSPRVERRGGSRSPIGSTGSRPAWPTAAATAPPAPLGRRPASRAPRPPRREPRTARPTSRAPTPRPPTRPRPPCEDQAAGRDADPRRSARCAKPPAARDRRSADADPPPPPAAPEPRPRPAPRAGEVVVRPRRRHRRLGRGARQLCSGRCKPRSMEAQPVARRRQRDRVRGRAQPHRHRAAEVPEATPTRSARRSSGSWVRSAAVQVRARTSGVRARARPTGWPADPVEPEPEPEIEDEPIELSRRRRARGRAEQRRGGGRFDQSRLDRRLRRHGRRRTAEVLGSSRGEVEAAR